MRSMCTAVIIVLAGLVAAEAQDSLVEETRSPLAGAELGLFFDVNFEEEAVLGRLFLPGIPRLAAELLYYPPIPWEDALNYTYTTSGFQAMNQEVLELFTRDLFPCDYPDADIIILLSKLHLKVKEVPVVMYPNSENKSMHSSPLNAFYYFFKMLLSMFVTKLRRY